MYNNLAVIERPTKKEKEANKQKWKTELNILNKTFANRWITKIFRDWGTPVKGGFVKLHSNINISECVFVHNIIKEYQPTRVIEIGCAMGVSGMVIMNALKLYCPHSSLVSVDPFQDTQWDSIGLKNIRKATKHSHGTHASTHTWIKQLSSEFWKNTPKNLFDLVFIDGDHSYEGCLLDIKGADACLKNRWYNDT